MTPSAEFAVVPVEVAFEGLRLPDGSMLTIALDQPRPKFAVLLREGEQISVVSLHDHVDAAHAACAWLEDEIADRLKTEHQEAGGRPQ